jgi:hypothetical protein
MPGAQNVRFSYAIKTIAIDGRRRENMTCSDTLREAMHTTSGVLGA